MQILKEDCIISRGWAEVSKPTYQISDRIDNATERRRTNPGRFIWRLAVIKL